MRGHDPNHTTPRRVQARRNHTQDDILAREDTRNLLRTDLSRSSRLHDADGGRAALLHELGDLLDGGLRAYRRGLGTRVHEGGQIGQRRLFPKGLDVGKHGSRLRVGAQTRAELGLDSSEGTVELLRGGGATLDLVKGLVEDLGDIEQTDDVALFVTDGLGHAVLQVLHNGDELKYTHQMSEMPLNHQLKRLCRTGRVASDHGIAGHDRADLGHMRVQTFRSDLAPSVSTIQRQIYEV